MTVGKRSADASRLRAPRIAPTAGDTLDFVLPECVDGALTPAGPRAVSTESPVTNRARHDITPEEYLERPGGLGVRAWQPRTTIAGKASYSAVTAAGDMWEYARGGEPMPGWVAGRLARAASTAVKRDRRDPAYVVKCAKNLPLLSKAFEEAWEQQHRDTPPDRILAAAVFDAYDLAIQHKPWSVIIDALRDAGAAGHSRVLGTYTARMSRTGRPAVGAAGRERLTQGESLALAAQVIEDRMARDRSPDARPGRIS